ncbi:non-ribosomal peptide synthetase [Thiohalophilus sp.]|uniref:non-ribosomal peptide synthetase n=1 Tax=Thiohalophilus sp. TaxID=3028392 RepID=UPI002ACD673E|nr:non-ribosomal peptide synthetase [Thiohalophilus sp.]MDZ7661195.1 non-ribosomal peptide synthetase [Thiohalophilus sp.]
MLNYQTLNEALIGNASDQRTVTYIEGRDSEQVISYRQLHEQALRMLGRLQTAGLKAGDELIILTRSNPDFIDAFWGAVLGGIVPVPVAVGISDEHRSKLYKIFNKLERPWLFTDADNLERLKKFAEAHEMASDYAFVEQRTLLQDQLDQPHEAGQPHTPQPEDVAFIQFSSGSTSDPKGVVLTHRNILTNLNAIAEGAGYTDTDISLSWMPLTHDMGLIGFHLNMVACNMSQCLIPTDLFSRRPLIWWQKASEKKATVLCSPNFGYKHFLKSLGDKQLENVDLSHVRVLYNGAEPISVTLIEQFLEVMQDYGLRREVMFTVYGLAEATLAVAFPSQGEMYRAVHLDRHKLRLDDQVTFVDTTHPDAVSFAIEGPPVRDMQIKITDERNGTLPENHIGDVQIKGPSVTAGYYRNEAANHVALTGDGWLNTGDQGFLTENNELVITGRTKEIIFANGLNYYPHDLENIALQCEQLELGKVVAYGVRQPDEQEDELLIFILYRGDLAGFLPLAREVTHIINEQTGLDIAHVIPVKRIPKTTSGKLQRRLLGDDYLKGEYDSVLQALQQQDNALHAGEDDDLNPTEREIKTICDEVLTDKPLHLHDNFFDVGISSLALAEIHQRIDDKHPGLIDVVDLFEYQTIAELAAFMDQKRAG